MYFVDRDRIEATLVFLEKQLQILEEQTSWDDEITRLALERIAQTSIDSVLDVGNDMIDGFIMRDPGSFDDIIDIMLDEKVITAEMSQQFKQLISLRKSLVQNYMQVPEDKLLTILKENSAALKKYPGSIREYIAKELGPISAFKK